MIQGEIRGPHFRNYKNKVCVSVVCNGVLGLLRQCYRSVTRLDLGHIVIVMPIRHCWSDLQFLSCKFSVLCFMKAQVKISICTRCSSIKLLMKIVNQLKKSLEMALLKHDQGPGPSNFWNNKKKCSTNAQSRFEVVVLDGVLRPLRV